MSQGFASSIWLGGRNWINVQSTVYLGGTVLLLGKSNNPVKVFIGKSVHNFGLFVDLVIFLP